MSTVEIRRADDETAQIAFDRVARKVRALFAHGYACKMPFKPLKPGRFQLETLPGAGGWKITVEPLPGHSVAEVLA